MTEPLSGQTDEMRRELRLIRAVVDMVPAMLAYWDASQRCVFANRAYEKWFGVSPNDLIGRHMRELLGPIYPLNLPFIEGALDGKPQEFEREIPDPEGGPSRYSQASYIPDPDEAGMVRGFYVLVSDITRRKTMEDDLREAKQSAEAALAQVKTLRGLIPICSWCRQIRNDQGYWGSLEQYLAAHTDAMVTHGMCDACSVKLLVEDS